MRAAAWTLYLFSSFVALLLGHAAAPAAAQQQPPPIPACPQLRLRITTSPSSLRPNGRKAYFTVKVVNTGSTRLSNVDVRLDLPTGLVAKPQPKSKALIMDNGTTAYWRGLNLKPFKRRVFWLKARACATATPGTFPITGAVYLVNASTSNVTCVSPATAGKSQVVRDGDGWGKGTGTGTKKTTDTSADGFRIKQAKGPTTSPKTPICPPPPDNGTDYVLRGESQRLLNAEFVGYTVVDPGRRQLQWTAEATETRVTACWRRCSIVGYTPTFFLSVQKTGAGACYCSRDRCDRMRGRGSKGATRRGKYQRRRQSYFVLLASPIFTIHA